ncbi:MAG: hypothetical protein DHS20C11_00660 [Lysobacteraceae bacterium]|nr:MAG: hypothetical protein DHS20C11_00660 [Xanthomonadaceae bacterium]
MLNNSDNKTDLAATSALALLCSLFLWHSYQFWHYLNDDAYITIRYATNLASGIGPYFNPGEHVEGYSNTLQMLAIAAISFVFGHAAAPTGAKLISVSFGVLAIVFLFALVRRLLSDRLSRPSANLWALLAASMLAVNPNFAVNSTSGLETTMFAALMIMAAWLADLETRAHRYLGSGLLFALLVLCRPEGVLLFAVFWITGAVLAMADRDDPKLKRKLLLLLANGITVGTVLIASVAVRYFIYDGELLPNTYFAKAGGFWGPALPYVASGLGPSLAKGVLLLIAIAAIVKWADFKRVAPLMVMATVAAALPLVVGSDWMPGYRFVVHALPVVIAVTIYGIAHAVRALPVNSHLSPYTGFAVVLSLTAGLWWLESSQRQYLIGETTLRAGGYEQGHSALAQHICSGPSAPSIALMDIGLISHICRKSEIIDITGLTDRFIAKSEGRFLDKRYDPSYVLDRRPDYVVTVLTIPRQEGEPPPAADAGWSFWTRAELNIYRHPDFREKYLRPADEPIGDTPTPPEFLPLVERLGAEYLFESADVGVYYVMAVFRRRAEVEN